MSLTLKQGTIVTEGHLHLRNRNHQPTPTEYNNFPVSKLLIIDEDHYLIASQQISQDPVEEQGRPYIRKFELKLYARDIQNGGFHQSENPDDSRYVRYYISHSTQDNYNFDAILHYDKRYFPPRDRQLIYVLNHDKIMRGDEDHDDANKIDLDVTEISNHTIVREVAQTRNFIVPGYQRFRPTEGYNVLDLEGDFWSDSGSKYGTKLAFNGDDKILIGTKNGLVHIFSVLAAVDPSPHRLQTLSYKNESYNKDTSFNDISRSTHILISPKYTYNNISIDGAPPGMGNIEALGKKPIILQGAGEFINVWCQDEFIHEGQDFTHDWEHQLKFSYNLIESLSLDDRSRHILKNRYPESSMIPYLSAVSKDLIDCESLIVSIVVDGIAQGIKMCFLCVLFCGNIEDVGENFHTNRTTKELDIRRLWFPKLFTPGLNNNDAIQFDFVIDYPNMVRLGSNNGITVFEQTIITSIEILDAQHFVTGDSDGVIIIWKFHKEITNYRNINNEVNIYGGDGEFSIVTYYQHTIPIDRGYTELFEYTDVNIKSIENLRSNKELLVHICGQDRTKRNKVFYNKI